MSKIVADLRRRFKDAEHAALVNWDIAAEVIDGEMSEPSEEDARYIDGFANLIATLPAVPAALLKTTEELRVTIGARRYGKMALTTLLSVPSDATAFVTTLNRSLQEAAQGATTDTSRPRSAVRAR